MTSHEQSHRALDRRRILSWALYDWANSAFATAVMAGFVPVLNKTCWNSGDHGTLSTFRLMVTISVASLVGAVLAPVLGAIADRGGVRKRLLLAFAGLGILMTGAMSLVGPGQWFGGLTAYGLALAGFSGANIFYDALLLQVCPKDKLDVVSALGYALGYVGGGLLFAFNVFMVLHPASFGFSGEPAAMRWGFATVAVWWALFTVPLLLWVPEARLSDAARPGWRAIIKQGLGDLCQTAREIRALRTVALFLVGYWFYIDGVGTVIKTAVDYGEALGFESKHLVTALLVTQFVGFPAALAFGWVGDRIGAKSGILIGLAVYVGVCIWGYRMQSVREFYGLAMAVGLVQGGIQSLSRSLYARLIPAEKAGQFFGFYNMLGKFAAVLGPVLVGTTAVLTRNSRVSMLALIGLFVVGALCLLQVQGGRAGQDDAEDVRENPLR